MRYELNTTDFFDDWLRSLDGSIKKRLASRLLQVECAQAPDIARAQEILGELEE